MADSTASSKPQQQKHLSVWRASQMAHRPVVDVQHVEQIGEVADLVFDPSSRQVLGLLIQRAGTEGSMVGMARRALGGALGLTFIPVARAVALTGDVVTVAPSQGAEPEAEPAQALPRLSKIQGFAVISIGGQRLGGFVDLLLDREGRRILGYLVEPGGRGAGRDRTMDAWAKPAAAEAPPAAPEAGVVEPPAGPAASAPELVMVPATLDVRVGRHLIIVATTPAGQTAAGADTGEQAVTPDEPTQPYTASEWHHWEADVPTEQMRH
jgi:sporulation protein YlmC with PRC-barrel domain